MLSLFDQINFQQQVKPAKKIRHASPVGYAGRTRQLEIKTMAKYMEALAKRKWSSSKQLMLDLGLKDTACVTKTMARDYMKAITFRRKKDANGSYSWSLKP